MLTARPSVSAAEGLELGDAYLRCERARGGAVRRGRRIVVLLPRVPRIAGALARDHLQPQMCGGGRGEMEGAQVQLRRHRPESTTRERVGRAREHLVVS